MEVPIQIAVRIRPEYNARDIVCLQSNPYVNQINFGNQQTFPVTYALPNDCTQNQVFDTTIFPLLHSLLEGCDVSVVSLGQAGTGKTYTLFGPGLHCALSESEYGVVPRSVREIFSRLALHSDRNFNITIAWTQICGENIQDLLGAGNVQCCSVTDAFQWLQLGMSNRAPHHAHTLFTITLEQQWIGTDGLLQHRISTASFADLTSSEKVYIVGRLGEPQAIPTDSGLLALDRIVTSLVEACNGYQTFIPYNQSTLTTLLKDSFGGRAKTLVIACVSSLLQDYQETLYTLQFISRVQNIRNFVTTNSFSNVTTDDYNENYTNEQDSVERSTNADMFGLQFAASQWLKLVSNAEDLFNKLVSNNVLSDQEKDQISEWLFLKQECEECLSSEETISIGVTEPRRSLGRIEEETETDHEMSTPTNIDTDEETETDIDFIEKADFIEKVDDFIEKFKIQTDQLIHDNYDNYFKFDEHFKYTNIEISKKTDENHGNDNGNQSQSCSPSFHLQGARGRRKSIHPGHELIPENNIGQFSIETKEFAEIRSSPEVEEKQIENEILKTCGGDPVQKMKALSLNTETKQNRIRQVLADLEGVQKQIEELEYTIQIKEQLIQDMIKNSETRMCAKQKFQKKRSKLEEEYYKARTELAQAESQLLHCQNSNEKSEIRNKIEKYRNLAMFYEKRLKDIESVKQIPEESARKVLELENSLHTSKKQMERLQKQLRKEEKRKACLELELISDKEKIAELEQQTNTNKAQDEEHRSLREVSARISHLDQVLKEKSNDLERAADVDEKESLRHEIRNLRRTRDCLVEQRCHLDRKLQKEKMLTDVEERKLLECEEAIEAIDAAIEYKNELICGRKEMDVERVEREKGEEMLMQRLMKLSENEMRTLLYKYFQKVIDLRDSSKKLEMQVIQLERECETSTWRVQALSHALQQVRLEGERRIVLLQRQHEDKLNLMLRHFAEETSTSSSTERKGDKMLARAIERNKQYLENDREITNTCNIPNSSNKNIDQTLTRYKHNNREERVIAKYREEGREKNRFIARFQELTRYHTEKRRIQPESTIPSQNLKQLQPSSVQPPTKVTRQKNKLIIQQGKPKKYTKN